MRTRVSYFQTFVSICIAGFWLFGTAAAGTTADQAGRVQAFERHWKQTLFKSNRSLHKQSPGRVEGTSTGSISGAVHGLDLSAIGTAYVEAMPVMREFEKDTSGVPVNFTNYAAAVDSNFTYRIEGLLPGGYILYAGADGYESRYFNDVTAPGLADTVFVRENADAGNIDFTLPKRQPGTGGISGTVIDAKNSDPVPNAVVYVYASDEPYYYGKNMADETGRFVIDELKSGSYIAEVYADGYVQEIYDGAVSYETATRIVVAEPNETSGIRFLLDRGGTISGTVFDMHGSPIPNVGIEVSAPKSADSTWMAREPFFARGGYTSTDEAGAYRVNGLADGEYLVRADIYESWYSGSKWYNDVEDYQYATRIVVQGDGEVSGIDFRFPVPHEFGVVSGKVVDLEDNPIAGAGIQVFTDTRSSDGFSCYIYGQTGPDGVYRLDKIPAGAYIVSCWAQSGWQTVYRYWPDAEILEGANSVTVDESGPTENIDFRIPITVGASVIEGVVRATDGHPLANANIQVMPADQPDSGSLGGSVYAWAGTDSTGHYSVAQLPAGTYILQGSYWENLSYGQQWYNGAESRETATPVVLGGREKRERVDFNLSVRPIYGTIAGVIMNAKTGQPIPRAYVEIRPISYEKGRYWFHWWNVSTVTDADGRYKLEWLTEGKYRVSVYADGGFAYYRNAIVPGQADSVIVTGGETATADIALQIRNDGPGAIRGKVTSDYGYDIINGPDSVSSAGAVRIMKTTIENPIDMAVVTAKPAVTGGTWPESERFYCALANPDGTYELKGLPAGSYYMQSFSSNYLLEYYNNVFDPSEATRVAVEGASPVENIDFSLSPMVFCRSAEDGSNKSSFGVNGASIGGQVTDASGKPVAGAVVYLLNEAKQPMASANTGSDGTFVINGIAPGSYFVQASKIGFTTAFNGNVGNLGDTRPVILGNGSNEINISMPTGVEPEIPGNPPKNLSLYPNFPNPFNPSTAIRFSLPHADRIRVTVYDLTGREVLVLKDGPAPAGLNTVTWSARNASGLTVTSGVYFYRIESAKEVRTGKMVYLR